MRSVGNPDLTAQELPPRLKLCVEKSVWSPTCFRYQSFKLPLHKIGTTLLPCFLMQKAWSESDTGIKLAIFSNAVTGQRFDPGMAVKGIFSSLFPN